MAYNEDGIPNAQKAMAQVILNRVEAGWISTIEKAIVTLAGAGVGKTHESRMPHYFFARYADFIIALPTKEMLIFK